ncbi:MAG TPA: hypothetical protein VJ979_03865 [Actinomycetota bacterium]|nr:hypothetical protein [Actinomycetota bacterium]
MTSHDLATLADALTFALLTTVSGAIGWAVFRMAARRYGIRRTAGTISMAAVATLAVGALAMWPAARGGVEGITGGAIPLGTAPEPQRTTAPGMPAPERAVEPVPNEDGSVDERTRRADEDRALDQEPNEEPSGEPAGEPSGGSGAGPADPGPDPAPPPPQSPSPDPPTTSPPTPSPTTPPSPSPDDEEDSDDDDDDDDDRLGDLVSSLESLLQLPD